jgi:hypothetical protein
MNENFRFCENQNSRQLQNPQSFSERRDGWTLRRMKAGRPAGRVPARYVSRCDPVTKQTAIWDLKSPKMDPTQPDLVRPAPAETKCVTPTAPELQGGAKPGFDLDLPNPWLDFNFADPGNPAPSFDDGDFFF